MHACSSMWWKKKTLNPMPPLGRRREWTLESKGCMTQVRIAHSSDVHYNRVSPIHARLPRTRRRLLHRSCMPRSRRYRAGLALSLSHTGLQVNIRGAGLHT
jgi:hypothetical protein